jgi:hypothetical protein
MQLSPSSTAARPATRCTSGNSLENSADETLWRSWRDRHDTSAARQFAKRHRRLVLELSSGLPWDDLIGGSSRTDARDLPVRSRSTHRLRHLRGLVGHGHPSVICPKALAARVRTSTSWSQSSSVGRCRPATGGAIGSDVWDRRLTRMKLGSDGWATGGRVPNAFSSNLPRFAGLYSRRQRMRVT